MGYLYISYSRSNTDVARRLVTDLENRGYTTWVDTDDLKTGDLWTAQIDTAIQDAEVFITLLSPATAANRTVQREIQLAEQSHKPIIPVLVEAASIPASLANYQMVDATGDWPTFIENLIRAIDASSASVPMRTKRAQPQPTAKPLPAAPARQASKRRLPMPLLVVLIVLIVISLLMVMLITQNAAPVASTDASATAAAVYTEVADGTGIARTATADAQIDVTAMEDEAATATAQAVSPQSTNITITQRPDATEIALRVEQTVAVFRATESNELSPAEAAQMMSLTNASTNLIYLTGILAALALGVAVAALVILRSGSNRGLARRTAHTSAHPGQSATGADTPPPDKMLEDYQIFVSSSDKDKEWVRLLVEDLEALDYSVWWYAKDAPGLPFGNEIRSAIYHTKVFLIIVSPDSMRSKHVEEEIRWAEIYDRPIVPVVCRETSIEERLYGLAKGADITFIDDYKEALELLAQAIDHYLQQRLEKMNVQPDVTTRVTGM